MTNQTLEWLLSRGFADFTGDRVVLTQRGITWLYRLRHRKGTA